MPRAFGIASSETHQMPPAELERLNANCVGGDIAGGIQNLEETSANELERQSLRDSGPDGIYVCSSSTPPGAGVHGMCGYHAAVAALRQIS